MRNLITTTTLLTGLLLSGQGSAQTLLSGQGSTCGFDETHQKRLRTDPAYRQQVASFDARVSTLGPIERGGGTYQIPVVVHVMDAGNTISQITDAEIIASIGALNERYRKVPGSSGDGNGVDVGVEFVLAVRDPDGNCTTGITRTDLSGVPVYVASGIDHGTIGLDEAVLKGYSVWEPTQYYNIWLVSEIDGNNGGNGVAGFAYFASSHGDPLDGTVMTVNSMRSTTSTVLAHELGHALNLYHTFQGDANGTACPTNGNCAADGDLVCDTPPHIRSPSNCNTGGTNACDGGSSNALFVHNYMDYSSSACTDMFTAGQTGRMIPALTTQRASYLAVNGNLSLVPPSAPELDIVASTSLLCGIGQSVRLTDNSRCLPNTFLDGSAFPGISYTWSLTNGTTTYTSTVQNPTFTINATGVFNATMSVTTGLGTFSRTESGIVVVSVAPVAACTPTTPNAANFAQTVSNVLFNTIANATSTIVNTAYTDFSCTQNTVVAQGATYPLSITINAGGSASESLNAYIDYNNNGTFEDPSERVATGSQPTNGSSTIVTNVTIPGTAVTNTLLRMRVYGEAGTLSANERNCSSALFIGDVEDYGVYISPNVADVSISAAPGNTITYGTMVTFTPTPVNGGGAPSYNWYRNGTQVSTGATYVTSDLLPGETVHCLLFSNLAGVIASPAMSNTITMIVTGPPLSEFTTDVTPLCVGGSVSFADASLLSPTSWNWSFPGGTPASSSAQNPVITYNSPGVYNVTLVASNGLGAGTTKLRTGHINVLATPPAACSISRSNSPTAGIGITRVQLNTIDGSTAYNDPVMNDFSCAAFTTLDPGTNYPISVTVGNFNNQWVRVYIDYDNNGVFADPSELVFSPATGTGIRSGSFTTPASPTNTNTLLRMRVISDFVNTTPGPCTNLQYGQSEEYGIVLAAPASVTLLARAVLEGPYSTTTGLMSDALRSGGLVPLTEPYTASGYAYVGTSGGTVAPSVLAVTGSDAIVDWVVVELRSDASPTTVVESRSALIQRDGDIVATDGVSPLSFGVSAGTYRVAVLHRNHFSVMTLNGVPLSTLPIQLDLSASGTAVYGTEARRGLAGANPAQAMWAGDVNSDGQLMYTGTGNDRDIILQAIGGTTATNVVSGYYQADVNLDGDAKYTGTGNDRDIILQNIGGTIATNVRMEQMP